MSCDWNIHCVDCNETETYDDANHRCDLMEKLVKHASAIAALAPLLAEAIDHIEIKTPYGRVDPAWFAKHAGHRLLPINEYGDLAKPEDKR